VTLLERVVGAAVLPITRRVEFPGKRRLRLVVPIPESGTREVGLLGSRFRLDLEESLHRDYYFGLSEQVEVGLLRRLLSRGGDFVDAGAHIGLYSVAVAAFLGSRGRVLAFEPNPASRLRLTENVNLNGCDNVIVSPCAVAEHAGTTSFYVPRGGDSAWSTLSIDRVDGSESIKIETTTLDAEVARHGLRPGAVKIDVEGHEVGALAGGAQLLDRRPALLVELVEDNAEEVLALLGARGYAVARVGTRGLEPWPDRVGASNAVFAQPEHLELLPRRVRSAFSSPRA
jgi:FkbM family methyltransferase